MKTSTKTNGVKVNELFETIDAVKETPALAKFKFIARNKWIDGGLNRTTMKDFHGTCQTHTHEPAFVFNADEPPVLLGEDKGPNPVEYVLIGLAGCLTTSMVYHAAARGIKINSIESTLEGDLDLQGFLNLNDDVRNGYEHIQVTFKIDADGPEEVLEELIQMAQDRSPVFDIVTNPVSVKVQVVKAASEMDADKEKMTA